MWQLLASLSVSAVSLYTAILMDMFSRGESYQHDAIYRQSDLSHILKDLKEKLLNANLSFLSPTSIASLERGKAHNLLQRVFFFSFSLLHLQTIPPYLARVCQSIHTTGMMRANFLWQPCRPGLRHERLECFISSLLITGHTKVRYLLQFVCGKETLPVYNSRLGTHALTETGPCMSLL